MVDNGIGIDVPNTITSKNVGIDVGIGIGISVPKAGGLYGSSGDW